MLIYAIAMLSVNDGAKETGGSEIINACDGCIAELLGRAENMPDAGRPLSTDPESFLKQNRECEPAKSAPDRV